MTLSTPDGVPAGWYPDPSGTRQWRVWTGSKWSEVTRAYGDPSVPERLATNLSLVQALGRVRSLGVVGVVGGLGLLVGVLAHWPGTAHPAPRWFALAASSTALAMLALGSLVCAFGARELQGRWKAEAFIPGVNFLLISALVARRLGRPSLVRNIADVVLLATFTASFHVHAWLGVAPMIVAFSQTIWVGTLVEELKGALSNAASAP